MKEYCLVRTTFDSKDEADRIAKMLLKNKYIALCKIREVDVLYNWNNETQELKGYELEGLTESDMYAIIKAFIRKNHSYELSETLFIPVYEISEEFGNWVSEIVGI